MYPHSGGEVSALPACVHEKFSMKMLFLVRDNYSRTVMRDCEFNMDKFNKFLNGIKIKEAKLNL